ncbi:MAG: PKD domain-containing protein, partial [Verrucomicrobiota bacterium]|nr:PKD domain-containing protein [Verrucomicrobiota bacterium]
VVVAVALCGIGASLGWLSFAATPSSGTLSPTTTTIEYAGSGPYFIPSTLGDTCDAPDQCDEFALTVNVPADYATTNPAAKVRVEISWDDPTGAAADFDLYVHDSNGAQIGGTSAATSANPEKIEFAAGSGTKTYTLRTKPYLPAGLNYKGKVTLIAGGPAGPAPTPAPFVGIAPRYYNYAPGPGIGENAGEPTVGFNLQTKYAMFISGLQTLRVTFPETGACDALWEDVSYVLTSKKSLDPILWTDQAIGRTFVSQLNSVVPPASPVLIGLNSLMAYTDDDGQTWTPAQLNPPDGSYDHQSVASGPYPPALAPALTNPANKGRAVYYCSQAGVTAFCSRSDDGGLNFGPGRNPYTLLDGCGGLHGHPMVAPDGTVYLPNRACNNIQSLAVSEDAGVTWTVRQVKGPNFTAKAPSGIIDPAVGIANDGTVYFAWASGETDGTHQMVSKSTDKGLTWSTPVDIGAVHNLKNTVFPRVIAGDGNRAAVGFIGTPEPGDHQAAGFKGTWFAYIATTYNGGQTWAVVNATPNDPVQKEACIWNGGGSNPCRNLLDFNGMTKDDKGRALYAYADGCVNDCVRGGPNSYSAKATIARQSGGKTLLAAFDSVEPALPQAACLSGHRDDLASYLSWKVADNGGAEILSYKILRGTTANNLAQVGTATGGKTTFTDRSGDPAVATYFYQIIAVNSLGDGVGSNIVQLTIAPRIEPTGACILPGVQVVVDPVGDPSDTLPQHDITSVNLSEPQDLGGKLVFTIKVVNLSQPVPPDFRYAVRFGAPTPPAPDPLLGAQEDYFVSYVSGAEQFTYGTTGVPENVPGRVFTTLGNLDPASNVSPDGTITLVLPKSVIGGPAPGQAITSVFGSVRLNGPTGGTNETIPDSTGTGSYQLRSATLCLPNTPPLAVLTGNPDDGFKPLPVRFDATGSKDSDSIDTIASYTYNFGDGTDDVTKVCSSDATCATIDHTFTEAGLYAVKLVVTDSRGKVSSNTAQQLIQVDVPFRGVASRRVHGTRGTFDIDLPLAGTAGIECRSPGSGNAYKLIYTFERNVLNPGSASKQQGTATVGPATIGPLANQVTVNLTGVSNAQHLIVMLNGVRDSPGAVSNNLPARMDVLLGDVNATGRTDSSDVTLVKQQNAKAPTQTTFRTDVNCSGRIDSSDVKVTQQASGTALP